ncbi:MAG: hypothetical protein AAGH83_11770, partial [Pseudomonadota bacterium]
TKDRVYVDVLSESINNPLRLVMGWSMVDASTLPPASVLLAYWFGGAFLMNCKRLAEYRDIVSQGMAEQLKLYRRSFRFYSERSLMVASLTYAMLSGFFIGAFLVKYRAEYIVLLPFLTLLFAEYFRLAMISGSVARKPEKLFGARRLMSYGVLISVLFFVLTFIDLPWVGFISEPNLIEIQ